jgi:pimeloyl-ACP methyl ester carboxylesterase
VSAVDPFRIAVPHAQVVELRRRLAASRWPDPETVSDWSQGLPLAVLRNVCSYWETSYDWVATERRLNRLPQFTTKIDGLSIHFFHLRCRVPDATPLIMTHGWPGSFFEFEHSMQRLSDPARFGDDPSRGFDVVVPSLPGYVSATLESEAIATLECEATQTDWMGDLSGGLGVDPPACGGRGSAASGRAGLGDRSIDGG